MTATELKVSRKQELAKLARKYRGKLSPEHIVEFATDPDTALHSAFEWDDSEAARKYRLEQARCILRMDVTIIDRGGDRFATRTYVNLSTERGEGEGIYRPLELVLKDEKLTSVLVEDALRELTSIKQKYSHLTQLARVWEAIEQAA